VQERPISINGASIGGGRTDGLELTTIRRRAHNHRIKLTGAAILVFRVSTFLQAAPAAYPYRSAANEENLMEIPSSSGPSPKAGGLATGVAIVILVILIAAVIGISFLPNPYYVIGQGLIIAGVVAVGAGKLRSCYRLTQTPERSAQLRYLHQIALWGFIGVLSAAGLLVELSTTESRPNTTVLVVSAFCLALLGALQLVEDLLKRGASTNSPPPSGAGEEPKKPPNPDMASAVNSRTADGDRFC
jgi:hypothetical protein